MTDVQTNLKLTWIARADAVDLTEALWPLALRILELNNLEL